VTNSVKETAYSILTNLGIKQFFDIIVTNQDITEPKPNPEGYLLAMDCIGADPEHTIIFEDSEIGLRSAYAAKVAKVVKVQDASEVSIDFVRRHL